MKHLFPLTMAALALAACHPTPKAPDAPVPPSPPAASVVAPAAPAAPTFVVNDLADTDGDIMGCTTMIYRGNSGPQGEIFVEDGVDTGAVGFMRIDGKLIKLALTSSTHSESGGVRSFTSADKALVVTENYIIGASHEESDSVDLKGTLDVSYRGELQSFIVNGGTAC